MLSNSLLLCSYSLYDLKQTHFATFEMQATLCENLQVEMLSQMFPSSAEMVAIMAVRQFPPRLSFSTMVSMELR